MVVFCLREDLSCDAQIDSFHGARLQVFQSQTFGESGPTSSRATVEEFVKAARTAKKRRLSEGFIHFGCYG